MPQAGTLWMDPDFSAAEQTVIVDSVPKARARLGAFYGSLKSPMPDIIYCKSAACRAYFAGTDTFSFARGASARPRPGGQYIFPGPTVVITHSWPDRGAAVKAEGVLTHEMSHIEMRARLGAVAVPPWFNEGVATHLANTRRCPAGARGIDNLDALATQRAWHESLVQDKSISNGLYCQASAAVKAWMEARGGAPAVVALLDGLAGGQKFDDLLQPKKEGAVVPDAAAPPPAQ